MRIALILLLLASFQIEAAPTPADAQYISNGNYLTNPSFEEGRSGWTNTNGDLVLQEGGTSIKRYAEITLASEALEFYQDFTLPPGMTGRNIFLSFDVKTAIAAPEISVCSVADTVEQECTEYSNSGVWETLTVGLEVGTSNRILVKSAAAITGVVELDDAWASRGGSGGGGGGGSIPAEGGIGSTLTKTSATEATAEWDQLDFSGFSSRFDSQFESTDLRDTLEKILDFQYLAPQVSLSGSSNTLREKGDEVASVTLSASVTKRSDDIARIRFLQGATVIQDYDPPAETGTGVTTADYNTAFSDNITFTVEVTDDGTSGGPTTVSDNTSYSFVYPYYHGADVPGLSAAGVGGLTKSIINSNSNLTRSFTTSDGDVYYFAYPASYGNLTSILDENSFEVIGSWTLRTENITGLDGNAVSYNIYEFDNTVTAGSTTFTFIR